MNCDVDFLCFKDKFVLRSAASGKVIILFLSLDFSKISFSTNANIVYDIYKKGYQIHCYVHPEEAQNYAKFVWGWYDPRKKVYRKFVDVDTFEEGAHHLTCSSPRSSVRPLNITFYVLREFSWCLHADL